MSEGAIEQVTNYIGNLESEVELWKIKCLDAQEKLKDQQKDQNELILSAKKELLQHCLSIRDAIEAVEKSTARHPDSIVNMIKEETIQTLDLKDLRQLSQILSVKLGLRASLLNVKSGICCNNYQDSICSERSQKITSPSTDRSEATCRGPIERIKRFVEDVCCGFSQYNFANESAEKDALSPSNKEYTERGHCHRAPTQQEANNMYLDEHPVNTNESTQINRTELTNTNAMFSNLSNQLLVKSNSNDAMPISKSNSNEVNTKDVMVFSRRVSTGRDKSARIAQPPPVPLLDFSKLY
ncbi:hypothetical protein BMR1_03g00325 [Babesia microti strain RI]|uniref:Uncharacterized protein n=1 Tax=Babesia microti (strain RI) TaxID=1133968 RepID=A0A0K3AQE2_BABMR|nr:hypothetical protein BMR1_03g00325 [Babesia microti strain RI]CTQ40665.1 hypothetical protein BMR1_03g00325 [Babesia microti strain RI]|eukprot:XP_012648676.1 hypothetical protein BMR1_03g00325 [Babesia microti strain RI]